MSIWGIIIISIMMIRTSHYMICALIYSQQTLARCWIKDQFSVHIEVPNAEPLLANYTEFACEVTQNTIIIILFI